jgi:tellurite resistance protein TerC
VSDSIWLWVGFNVFVLAFLALDLGVLHRKSEVIGIREALIWSGAWLALALLFNVGVYLWRDSEVALQFLAGYLIERSLSIDNIFVFLLVFSYFRVPAQYQYKVLFWGIIGALVTRAVLIAAGVTLVQRFDWVLYLFGAFLIYTGIRLVLNRKEEIHPNRNIVLRLFRRLLPVTTSYDGDRFLVRQAGRLVATPLLVVLVIVETTDVVFAIDSIPAILGITVDPFIVYTSNVFAILGLRAMYFAVAGLVRLVRYLDYGLSAVLIFIGAKMLAADVYHMPVGLALAAVAVILGGSVVASLLLPARANTVAAGSMERVAGSSESAAGGSG